PRMSYALKILARSPTPAPCPEEPGPGRAPAGAGPARRSARKELCPPAARPDEREGNEPTGTGGRAPPGPPRAEGGSRGPSGLPGRAARFSNRVPGPLAPGRTVPAVPRPCALAGGSHSWPGRVTPGRARARRVP